MITIKTKLRIVFQTGGGGGSSVGLTFSDWDASTNLAPEGLPNTLYTAQNNSDEMIMPDGGIVTAGIIAIAKVANPSPDITEKTDWLLFSSVWGDETNAPEVLSLEINP